MHFLPTVYVQLLYWNWRDGLSCISRLWEMFRNSFQMDKPSDFYPWYDLISNTLCMSRTSTQNGKASHIVQQLCIRETYTLSLSYIKSKIRCVSRCLQWEKRIWFNTSPYSPANASSCCFDHTLLLALRIVQELYKSFACESANIYWNMKYNKETSTNMYTPF